MKLNLLLIIGILQCATSFGQPYCMVYQKALDDFIQNEWNNNFLKYECTGLKFDQSLKIEINISEPLTVVDLSEVSHYLDSNLFNFLNKKKFSREDFNKVYNNDLIFAGSCINFSNYKQFIKTKKTEPNKQHEYPFYYMRMSSLFFWSDHIYLSCWIKKSKYSSGTHIIYKFDSDFNILDKRIYNMCDEIN